MHIEVRDKLADAMISADPNLHISNPSVMFGFHTCTGARRVEQGGKAAEFYSYQKRRHVNYIIVLGFLEGQLLRTSVQCLAILTPVKLLELPSAEAA